MVSEDQDLPVLPSASTQNQSQPTPTPNPNSGTQSEQNPNPNSGPESLNPSGTASLGHQPSASGTDASSRHHNPLYNPPTVANLSHADHSIFIKLSTSNYLLRCNNLTHFLRGQALFDFVSGDRHCPPPTSPDYAAWIQQDATIMSCIISSLSEPVMPDSLGKPTSHALWLALKNTYAPISAARAMELQDQLRELTQGDSDVTTYLNKALLIRDALVAIGCAPGYSHFLCQVLGNLNLILSEMRTSILARNCDPPFEEVKSLLIAHESMLRRTSRPPALAPPEPPHPSLHHVTGSDPSAHSGEAYRSLSEPSGGSRFQSRSSGYVGGSSRSHQNQGRNSYRSRGRSGNQGSRFQQRDTQISCQLCGQRDHLATTCP